MSGTIDRALKRVAALEARPPQLPDWDDIKDWSTLDIVLAELTRQCIGIGGCVWFTRHTKIVRAVHWILEHRDERWTTPEVITFAYVKERLHREASDRLDWESKLAWARGVRSDLPDDELLKELLQHTEAFMPGVFNEVLPSVKAELQSEPQYLSMTKWANQPEEQKR